MSQYNILTYHVRQAPIDAAKAAFFARGGQVKDLGLCERVPHCEHVPPPTISQKHNARRAEMAKERALADLIAVTAVVDTGFGDLRRTVFEVRALLKAKGYRITAPEIEQMAAKHGIRLAVTTKNQADDRDTAIA